MLAFLLLWSPMIPRSLAYFGWQLMHAALPLGAERVPFALSGSDRIATLLEDTSCAAAACFSERGMSSSLETYTHTFVECSSVAPAWAWVRARWQALADEQPPADVRALVAGDHTVWAPADRALWPLWTVLRLCVLRAIWVLRCARRAPNGPQFDPDAVIAAAACLLSQLIRLDWLRVRRADGCPRVHVSTSSDAVTRPALTHTDFVARWCRRSVLAHVRTGGVLVISVRYGDPAAATGAGEADDVVLMDTED